MWSEYDASSAHTVSRKEFHSLLHSRHVWIECIFHLKFSPSCCSVRQMDACKELSIPFELQSFAENATIRIEAKRRMSHFAIDGFAALHTYFFLLTFDEQQFCRNRNLIDYCPSAHDINVPLIVRLPADRPHSCDSLHHQLTCIRNECHSARLNANKGNGWCQINSERFSLMIDQ